MSGDGTTMLSSIKDPAGTIFFGEPFRMKNGQNMVPTSMTNGQKVCFQMGDDEEMLHTTYGLNTPLPGGDPLRHSVDVVPTVAMMDSLRKIDEHVGMAAGSNSQAWFGTDTNRKQQVSIVGKNETVRIKTNGNTDDANHTRVHVMTKGALVPGKLEDIERGSDVVVVASTLGMWHNAAQFGISLMAKGIIVRPPASSNGIAMFNLKRSYLEMTEEEGARQGEEEDVQ